MHNKSKKTVRHLAPALGLALAAMATTAQALTVTFDDATGGQTSFNYDADNDGINDAVFTSLTGDPFSITGPGPNQLYIQEPGLENSSTTGAEFRVDFPNGATTSAGVSFALSVGCSSVGSVDPSLTASLQLFDAGDTLLGQSSAEAVCTETSPGNPSGFVEAQIDVPFTGTAAYALFDINDAVDTAFIADNFTGTFGSVEQGISARPVPTLPAPLLLLAGTLLTLSAWRGLGKRR